MQYRYLGDSGLMVSEMAFGNWITHAGQIEEEAALACVTAALDAGITTFDTADIYAGTRPRTCSAARSRASAGRAWRSSPRCTGPPDRAGTTVVCRASTSSRRATAPCAGSASTTSTCTRPTASTTRPRSRKRCGRSTTSCAPARSSTSAFRSGAPRRSRRPWRSPSRWASTGSSPTSRSTACCTASSRREVHPHLRHLRHRADRVVTDGPGRAQRQVPAGSTPAGGLTRHGSAGLQLHQAAHGRRDPHGGATAAADRLRPRTDHGAACPGVGAAEPRR